MMTSSPSKMAASFSKGSLRSLSVYERILSLFPVETLSFCFAYGSGVLQQANSRDASKNMLDVVFVVNDPLKFHARNLLTNRDHYSTLKWGGSAFIARIQSEFGAGVYYNTLIPFEERMIKYGVISSAKLIADLLDWETLYISGRLHKPVLVLKQPSDTSLTAALRMNLHNAVHTALLLLPELFTEDQLFVKIAGLSYSGDFRMWAGEDRNKIAKIVEAQSERFHDLYLDILSATKGHIHWHKDRRSLEQDRSPASRLHHLNLLPKHLQLYLYRAWNRDGRNRDLEDVLKVIAHDIDSETIIEEGVESIVRRSSWSQSLKGILTAGLVKSVRYGAAKVTKMVKSWQS